MTYGLICRSCEPKRRRTCEFGDSGDIEYYAKDDEHPNRSGGTGGVQAFSPWVLRFLPIRCKRTPGVPKKCRSAGWSNKGRHDQDWHMASTCADLTTAKLTGVRRGLGTGIVATSFHFPRFDFPAVLARNVHSRKVGGDVGSGRPFSVVLASRSPAHRSSSLLHTTNR